MLIDTHCHLDAAEFAEDRAAVVARAQAAGVQAMVVPAVEVGNFAAVRDCCLRYPACLPAWGIHPMYTPQAGAGDLAILRRWLETQRPLALGEIGLDYFVPGLDRERQQYFFVEQLKLAREFELPVLLHVRRAVDPILAALRRVFGKRGEPGGIAHAFNGSRQQAEAFIALGFRLGFGGAVTWTRATRLRELAATLPLAAIVLETDAPDIPPEFIGRARNEPAFLARTAATVAGLRGLSPAELAAATSANARSVLPGLLS